MQAFRRGRQAIADADALGAAVRPVESQKPSPARRSEVAGALVAASGIVPGEVRDLMEKRAAELVDYQSAAYAAEYVDFVRDVSAAELAAVGEVGSPSAATAAYLFKLMAYKDEYEVARLILDQKVDDSIAAEFGEDATYAVKLHPPMLRSLGLKSKLSFGPWSRPVFRLLHAMRRLRGTPLDVFGYHRVRRVERELIGEYRRAISAMLPHLDDRTLATAARVAALPDRVRGYQQIKLDNVAVYRRELAIGLDEVLSPGRLVA